MRRPCMFMVMTTNGTTTLPSDGIFMGKKDRILMQSQERPSVEESDPSQSLKLIRIKLIKVTEFGLKQLLKIKSITKMILSLN